MKLIIFIFAFALILILGCTSSEQAISTKSSQVYDNFCESLSKCDSASVLVKTSDTNDVYLLSIQGITDSNCDLKLSLNTAGSQATKKLEGRDATCTQKWRDDFKYLNNLASNSCRTYVNNLLVNLALELKKDESLCSGSLRDMVRK